MYKTRKDNRYFYYYKNGEGYYKHYLSKNKRTKSFKRQANHALRKILPFENLQKGGWYKKVYEYEWRKY